MKGKIRIGTSGWHYDHWNGPFYPNDAPKSRRLDFYRRCFRTVEINNTFYRLPARKTFQVWKETVDPSFRFAVKASRYITHMKKLKDPAEPLAVFLDRISILAETLGPVLFQLPPRWGKNPQRLAAFLEQLPAGLCTAFEFRDRSWFTDDVYRLLKEKNAALCIYELAGLLSPQKVTADFIYVRLHGLEEKYRGSYDTNTLRGWADTFNAWSDQGKDVYCYFDNDQNGYAARNAAELDIMIERSHLRKEVPS